MSLRGGLQQNAKRLGARLRSAVPRSSVVAFAPGGRSSSGIAFGLALRGIAGTARTPAAASSVALDARQEIEFSTVSELFEKACAAYANRHAFGVRVGDKFEWVTYKELYTQVQRFRNVLAHHNIGCVAAPPPPACPQLSSTPN